MKKIDIILLIEHKDRELDSIILLKEYLEKEYGISSIVLQKHYHLNFIYKIKPKMVVFPGIVERDFFPVADVYEVYGDSVIYANLNWEQLLTSRSKKSKRPRNDFTKKQVIQFVWNPAFRDFLIENGVDSRNVRLVGNIPRDLLLKMKEKKDYYRELLTGEFNLSKEKKWLFFPMNYGWAFFSDTNVQALVEQGDNHAWEFREYVRSCFSAFIDFLNELSKLYDFEFIVRPHPLVSPKEYESALLERFGTVNANIHLNKSYSIREWIVASDYVGSSWSTSAYDAYLIGMPSFFFTPIPRPQWYDTDWLNELANVANIEEFEHFLDTAQKGIVSLEKTGAVLKTAEEFKLALEDFPRLATSAAGKKSVHHKINYYTALRSYLMMKYFNKSLRMGFEFDWFEPVGVGSSKVFDLMKYPFITFLSFIYRFIIKNTKY